VAKSKVEAGWPRCPFQIGIAGSWDQTLPPWVYQTAEALGRNIAERGDIVFTGGSTGVMEAAMRGAKKAGGVTVGLLPTARRNEYVHLGGYIDIHVMTGMGELGKMAPLIQSVSGLIGIAGGSGTLIEIAMAYTEAKPVVLIPVQGYTSAALRSVLKDAFLDHRRKVAVSVRSDAESAINTLYESLM
jgi:hypothetical protein